MEPYIYCKRIVRAGAAIEAGDSVSTARQLALETRPALVAVALEEALHDETLHVVALVEAVALLVSDHRLRLNVMARPVSVAVHIVAVVD